MRLVSRRLPDVLEDYENDKLMRGKYFKKNHQEPISTIVSGSGTASIYDEDGSFLRKITYLKGVPIDPE